MHDELTAYLRRQKALRDAGSSPEALAERARRYAEASAWRERQAERWPLSADELARRAEADARPVDQSWQDGAADPECVSCGDLGRACPGHLGAHVAALAARWSDCEACGGSGRILGDTDGRRVAWRACQACNACPPYPGLLPGGLAARAMPVAPRRRESLGELARAKAFWRWRDVDRPAGTPAESDLSGVLVLRPLVEGPEA